MNLIIIYWMKEKASNEWNNPEGTEPFMHRVGLTLGTRNTCEWSLPASSGFWGQWQSQQKHCSYSFFFPAYFLLGFPSPSLEGRTCWHRWGSKIKRPRESLRDCSFWFFFFPLSCLRLDNSKQHTPQYPEFRLILQDNLVMKHFHFPTVDKIDSF